MKLIDKDAAIAAMRKATKGEAFNPFKVLNEVPEVEAVTMDELQAALNDLCKCCLKHECEDCDYGKHSDCICGFKPEAREFITVYRRRKEAVYAE